MTVRRFLRKQTVRSASVILLKTFVPIILGWIGIDYLTEGQLGGIYEAAATLIAEIVGLVLATQ